MAQNVIVANRKAELMLRLNAAVRMNNKAVIDEQLRINDPQYERKQTRDELYDEKKLNILQKGKEHMTESAIFSLK